MKTELLKYREYQMKFQSIHYRVVILYSNARLSNGAPFVLYRVRTFRAGRQIADYQTAVYAKAMRIYVKRIRAIAEKHMKEI